MNKKINADICHLKYESLNLVKYQIQIATYTIQILNSNGTGQRAISQPWVVGVGKVSVVCSHCRPTGDAHLCKYRKSTSHYILQIHSLHF